MKSEGTSLSLQKAGSSSQLTVTTLLQMKYIPVPDENAQRPYGPRPPAGARPAWSAAGLCPPSAPPPPASSLGCRWSPSWPQPGVCWAPGRAVSRRLAGQGDQGRGAGGEVAEWPPLCGEPGASEPPTTGPSCPLAGPSSPRLELRPALLMGSGDKSDSEPGGTASTWVFFLVIVDL